jgi:hypothetical protein
MMLRIMICFSYTFHLAQVVFTWILLLVFASAKAQSFVQPSSAQWQEDLQYLSKIIKTKHFKPFHTISEAVFDASISQLYAQIPSLEPYQIMLAFEKIGASIGDGHTWVSNRFQQNPYHFYPVFFRCFDDDFRIVAIDTSLKKYLGYKVIRVENKPIREVISILDEFIPKNENKFYQQYWEGDWLRNAEALYYSNISKSKTGINYTLQNDSGEEKNIALNLTQSQQTLKLQWAYPRLNYMNNHQESIWFQWLNDKKTFYIKMNHYPSKSEMKKLSTKILTEIAKNTIEKLIFDFRMNGGGDMKVGLILIESLAHAKIHQRAKVYAITGDHTFSAAMANAFHLREKMQAQVVGEPPTNRPNCYTENTFFELPHSKIQISVSTQYYQFQKDGSAEMKMDKLILRNFRAFQTGKDEVLDWILSN